jgi:hypothetical protein
LPPLLLKLMETQALVTLGVVEGDGVAPFREFINTIHAQVGRGYLAQKRKGTSKFRSFVARDFWNKKFQYFDQVVGFVFRGESCGSHLVRIPSRLSLVRQHGAK